MVELNRETYSHLLNNPKVKTILSQKITAKGGYLDEFWNGCEATSEYYTGWNLMEQAEQDNAKILVFADYLTYVPYGSAGYNHLEETLNSSKENKTVAEFRYDRLKDIMGKDFDNLSKEQAGYIKSYFENYNKEEINLKDVSEVVSLICRVHHECEANYKTSGYRSTMEIYDRMKNFADEFVELYNKQDTIKASEILNDIPKQVKLNETEKNYINEMTGLDSSASTKQP